MNPYEVLGLARTATQAQIKSAYRARAKALHPDAGGGKESWAELQLAYEVLSDADARAHYDATGTINAPKADNRAGQIIGLVIAAFDTVMTGALDRNQDPAAVDFIASMIQNLTAQKTARAPQLKNIARLKAELGKVQKRMKRRKGKKKGDQIGAFIAARLAQLDVEVARIEDADKLTAEAIELVKDYEFDVAPQEQIAGMQQFFFVTRTTEP